MDAAMHTRTVNDKTAFGLRTTDLRTIAIGFAAAILLVMVAGQIQCNAPAREGWPGQGDNARSRIIGIRAGAKLG